MQYKKIKLSKGKYALVSCEDFDYLNQFSWHYLKNPKDKYGYAVSSTPPVRNKKMHRLILKVNKGQIVDHINFNGIDNRRENLRVVTASESSFHKRLVNKYGSKGISRIKDKKGIPKYWIARITINGKRIYLGTFKTKKEAIRTYKENSLKYYGI